MSESMHAVLIVLCMVGTAFYAGIETGMVSIHRMRLRHFVREGLAGAEILEGFLAKPIDFRVALTEIRRVLEQGDAHP